MSWNYRVVQYLDNRGYGLHEVYYDDEGFPWGMTAEPTSFVCDLHEGSKGIVESLMQAKMDAQRRSIFCEPETWLGKNPGDDTDEK